MSDVSDSNFSSVTSSPPAPSQGYPQHKLLFQRFSPTKLSHPITSLGAHGASWLSDVEYKCLEPVAVTSTCFQGQHRHLPDAIDYFFWGGGAAINLCLSLVLFVVFLAVKLLVWKGRCTYNGENLVWVGGIRKPLASRVFLLSNVSLVSEEGDFLVCSWFGPWGGLEPDDVLKF